ncbi:hypothetical protein B484DRAFT_401218, partial [Ochromonadaceae sp. CCMP2298]
MQSSSVCLLLVMLALLGPASCGCPYNRKGDAEPETSRFLRATASAALAASFNHTQDEHRRLQASGGSFCQQNRFAAVTSSRGGVCRAYNRIIANLPSLAPTPSPTAPTAGPTPAPAADVEGVLARASLYGTAVRLAFHDAGEADLSAGGRGDSMGPDGCLSDHEGNSGLVELDSLVLTQIEPLWQDVCRSISRADFWALFASIVVQEAASLPTSVSFAYGRKDNVDCSAGAGRLPGAQFGLEEVLGVFEERMGLTLTET